MESLQEIVLHVIIIHLQSDLSPSAIEVMTMHSSLLGFAWQSWLKTLVNGKIIILFLCDISWDLKLLIIFTVEIRDSSSKALRSLAKKIRILKTY